MRSLGEGKPLQTLRHKCEGLLSFCRTDGVLLIKHNKEPLVRQAHSVQDTVLFFRQRALVARYQNKGIRLW